MVVLAQNRMSSSKAVIVRLSAALVTLAVVWGHGPAPGLADDDKPPSTSTPKHFILNPDRERPADYPVEISLKELEAFLKTQPWLGQGCGHMTWEGVSCGMFCNGYAATKTPWLKTQVELDASYAQTKTGVFLASLTIGKNTYSRADRNKNTLIWARTYEPEYEQQAIHQILYGKDSGKRKKLLTRIDDSFQDLDLAQFTAKSRELLKLQLQQCETDPDPEVVKLARKIRGTLTVSDPKR